MSTTTDIKDVFPVSSDTQVPEGVTQAIHRIGVPGDGDEEVFRWLQSKLRTRAEMILRRFAKLSGSVDPDQLVSEFMLRLMEKIGAESVKNRDHFFGLACNNFRWILLDMAKRTTRQMSQLPEVPQAAPYDIELFMSLMEYMDDRLTEQDRQLINMRLVLDFRWKNIEAILGVPKATLSDRLKKLVERMRSEISITWDDTNAD